MTKLLFLFDDSENFLFRISEEGFSKTCEKLRLAPLRIITQNSLMKEPQPLSLLCASRKKNSFLYRVKPADTLQSLCEKFNLSEKELLEYNCAQYIYPYMFLEIFQNENI